MNDSTGWWLDEYDGPRFWKYVNFNGGFAHESDPLSTAEGECWIWTGARVENDYGRFRMGPKNVPAHRIAYLDGSRSSKIPEGWVVDHLCRNASCVRPEHLEAVPQRENVGRGKRGRANITHCPQGHEYTDENTKMVSRGNGLTRYCAICLSASKRRAYLRSKQDA